MNSESCLPEEFDEVLYLLGPAYFHPGTLQKDPITGDEGPWRLLVVPLKNDSGRAFVFLFAVDGSRFKIVETTINKEANK